MPNYFKEKTIFLDYQYLYNFNFTKHINKNLTKIKLFKIIQVSITDWNLNSEIKRGEGRHFPKQIGEKYNVLKLNNN